MSYADKIAQELEVNKEYVASGSSDWFKFKEGINIVRILVEPAPMFEDYKMGICYHDCGFQGSPKFLAYILDKSDGKIKLMKIPNVINEQIIGFEKSSRFTFDGFPMPYDLEINAKNAGTKEVVYTVLPGTEDILSENVLFEIEKKKPVIEIIEILKKKNLEKHMADGTRNRILQERDSIKKQINDAKARAVDIDPNYPQNDIDPEDIDFEPTIK